MPGASVQVLYTGHLFGYFTAPNQQDGHDTRPCGSIDPTQFSPAAQAFDAQRRQAPDAVLVATGDNFAPELEAREFSKPPDSASNQTRYMYGKDLYDWWPMGLQGQPPPKVTQLSDGAWVDYQTPDKLPMDDFNRFLSEGWGFVRHDNAACFLVREGVDALVPGKQDFYFGPERLRMLARYLASTRTGNDHATALLGANLIIETTDKRPSHGAPDHEKRPVWPGSAKLTLPKGDTVYPWYAGASFQVYASTAPNDAVLQAIHAPYTLAELAAQLPAACSNAGHPCPKSAEALQGFGTDSIYLCPALPDGSMPKTSEKCKPLQAPEVMVTAASIQLEYWFPARSDDRHYTLEPGQSYGICLEGTASAAAGQKPRPEKEKGGQEQFACQPFSVFTPFFSYHTATPPNWTSPGTASDWATTPGEPFTEPPPFVEIKAAGARTADVAIFGVLDPDVETYVGALNLDWLNVDAKSQRPSEYKTVTAIEDPGEALTEQVMFFNHEYKVENGHDFTGVRVLLAQMEPQEAHTLLAREKSLGFSMVVSAADDDFATTGQTVTSVYTTTNGALPPAQLAVPLKYYDRGRADSEVLQIGSMNFTSTPGSWQVAASNLQPGTAVATKPAVATGAPSADFLTKLQAALRACGATDAKAQADGDLTQPFQLVTLCAMQRALSADVVLLQERDLFTQLPPETANEEPQQVLDRVLWKGDYLTLMYVPGSALVKVMQLSDNFKNDFGTDLSLTDEGKRDLITLGLTRAADGSYWVDNQPLDTTRLYAVATSDYIGAGDTGYPNFQTAAVNPHLSPDEFPDTLETISSVVCRSLYGTGADEECQPPIDTRNYFDTSSMTPLPSPRDGTGLAAALARLGGPPAPKTASSGAAGAQPQAEQSLIEDQVQQRPIAAEHINQPSPSLLAVDNASFGLNTLDHRFSDAEMKTLFPDSPVTQLAANDSHTTLFDIRTSSEYSLNHADLFENIEAAYNTTYQGGTATENGTIVNVARSIQQRTNLFSSDTGVMVPLFGGHEAGHWTWFAGRQPGHWNWVSSLHYETQLFNPLPGIQEQLSLSTSSPSYVGTPARDQLLLPREGVKYVGFRNWLDFGLEDGEEIHAVRASTSSTGVVTLTRPNIGVSGAYWDWHFIEPVTHRLDLTIDNDSDLFFNRPGDADTDTRFRADTKAALNFHVFGSSLQFAPTYELFLYQNKVQNIWFWQGQASIEMKFRFDVWNIRQPLQQMEYSSGGQ